MGAANSSDRERVSVPATDTVTVGMCMSIVDFTHVTCLADGSTALANVLLGSSGICLFLDGLSSLASCACMHLVQMQN